MASLKSLSKSELITQVAARTGLDSAIIETVLDAVLEEIYVTLKRGQGVTLKNFGTFFVRPERTTWVFKFNPSQRLRAVFGWSSTYTGDL